MVHATYFENRDEWLKERGTRLGGSDAACIIGKNPWKSNVQLYREKTGSEEPKEVSNDRVKYGVQAEPLLRRLFKMDHPDLTMDYQENNLWINDDLPFAHASLDGWFAENGIVTGVLEIKTATIMNMRQEKDWKDRIPDHYYCQVLWYMMVTGAQEAWIYALLRWERNKALTKEEIRTYKIERCPQIEAEINMLRDAGERFWKQMEAGEEPALILTA